jgi:hypothetical protein
VGKENEALLIDESRIPLEHCQRIQQMFKDLKDYRPETAVDAALGTLHWKDFPAL